MTPRPRNPESVGGRIEVRLPVALDREIARVCERQGISRAAAMRQALRQWLDRQAQKR